MGGKSSPPQRSVAVVGVQFPNRDGSNRQSAVAWCDRGEVVELRPEPRNPHDPRAIAVFARGQQLGYLPAERAPQIFKLLAEGTEVKAVFQEVTAYGAAIRVAFDGEIPTLPDVPAAQDGRGSPEEDAFSQVSEW